MRVYILNDPLPLVWTALDSKTNSAPPTRAAVFFIPQQHGQPTTRQNTQAGQKVENGYNKISELDLDKIEALLAHLSIRDACRQVALDGQLSFEALRSALRARKAIPLQERQHGSMIFSSDIEDQICGMVLGQSAVKMPLLPSERSSSVFA